MCEFVLLWYRGLRRVHNCVPISFRTAVYSLMSTVPSPLMSPKIVGTAPSRPSIWLRMATMSCTVSRRRALIFLELAAFGEAGQ